MTESSLDSQAAHLQAEAGALLQQAGLLALLQRYGSVYLNGSFALNLMIRRDLDIAIRLNADLDISTFFQIGADLTQHFQVQKASFSNHFIRGLPEFDHGLYWGVQLLYQDRSWKLDLWGFGPSAFETYCAKFAQLRHRLENADRTAILDLKDRLHRLPDYSGLDVYNAVAGAGVKTVEAFRAWQSQIKLKSDSTL